MLGLMLKIFVWHVILLAIIVCFPWRMEFEPKAYETRLQELEGTFTPNVALESVEFWHKGKFVGPESIDYHDGIFYTGVYGGHLLAIKGNEVKQIARIGQECKGMYDQQVCGRPLGLRVSHDGSQLLVADSYHGIFLVDIATGDKNLVVAHGVDIGGTKLELINDLVSDGGVIYFTETSSKYPLYKIVWSILEHDNSGRVMAYDPIRQHMQILMDGLNCPNGIQLSHDSKSLLIVETSNFRILRYHLEGPKRGQHEVFAQNLPGEPDNIRKSSSGGYWVGFVNGRPKRTIGDVLSRYPTVRLAIMRLLFATGQGVRLIADAFDSLKLRELSAYFSNGWVLYDQLPKYGLVAELDANGAVKRTLHAPSGRINFISEVLEHDGHLYLGSFRNDFIGKVKLNN